jgi:hypothetical protein
MTFHVKTNMMNHVTVNRNNQILFIKTHPHQLSSALQGEDRPHNLFLVTLDFPL